MGYLRRLDDNADIQAFPGATFETAGETPPPQCSEAQIESTTGITTGGENTLTDIGKFAGFALAGKVLTVTFPPPNARDYNINGNTDDFMACATNFTVGSPANEYYVHDGGELILTRNAKSFAEYIHAAGYAYTIKGGKLYTNMPSGQLKDACTILFDPIT